MCFSAPASFIASGGLAVLGGSSLKVARKEDKILAAIPLIFALQQAFEGIQWLHLNVGTMSLSAGYAFLFFAFIVWPIYVPVSVFLLEKDRRTLLGWCIALGVLVGLYFTWILFNEPLIIQKLNHCINYNFYFPLQIPTVTAYIIATFAPLFISKRPIFRWFGAVTFILALISWTFFYYDFTSVWCFFAAIVSSMFFVYIIHKNAH